MGIEHQSKKCAADSVVALNLIREKLENLENNAAYLRNRTSMIQDSMIGESPEDEKQMATPCKQGQLGQIENIIDSITRDVQASLDNISFL